MKNFIITILIISLSFLLSCNNTNNNYEEIIASKYPNGRPSKIEYYKWNNNKREIIKEVRLYPDGEKQQEGEYLNGKRNGKWIYWYDNGNVWSEGYFKDDVMHGKSTVFYKNGKKNYEGSYNMNKPDGLWIFYDDNGAKLKEVVFKNGEKKSEKNFE